MIGVYDSFTYGQTHERLFPTAPERFMAIRDAGFDVVMNYGTGPMNREDALRYADQAAFHGVKVIWNPWTGPASWSNRWLEAVDAHSATWGYYVGDEAAPASAEESLVRVVSKYIRSRSSRPTLYVCRPGAKAMRPFLDVASHVGPDCYPIGSPPWWAKPEPQRIGDVAQWARRMVDEPGGAKKLAFVCQCFAWGALTGEAHPGDPVIWPSGEQMAAMKRAVVKRGHPDLLLWFSMAEITDHHPNPEAYWRTFVEAAT